MLIKSSCSAIDSGFEDDKDLDPDNAVELAGNRRLEHHIYSETCFAQTLFFATTLPSTNSFPFIVKALCALSIERHKISWRPD